MTDNERRIEEAYNILNKLELEETHEADKRIWCLFYTGMSYQESEELRADGRLTGATPYYTSSLSMIKVIRGPDWWYDLHVSGTGLADCTMGYFNEGEPLQVTSGSQPSEERAVLVATIKLHILIWRGNE